jgi:4-hydroxy-2-oxoheptanedioate aldolase
MTGHASRSLAEALRADQVIPMAWSSLAATAVVDLLAEAPFGAVTLDMQHGAHDEASVFAGLSAIRLRGKGACVRIPVGRYDMASRALDFGADLVIAPMINSLQDARLFAAAMKYPPVGERSWGPQRALRLHQVASPKDYLGSANRTTLSLAMIETRAALAILDDILDVDGIDGVFVGPSDFSISWTGGTGVDPYLPDMMDAVSFIAERCRAHNKVSGIFIFDPARARDMVTLGYRFLAMMNDVAYLGAGAQSVLATAKLGDH